jgi:hypothetical protein
LAEHLEGRIQRGSPGVEHNRPGAAQAGEAHPHCFPHATFQAVSHDSVAGGTPDGETDTWTTFSPLLANKKRGEQWASVAHAVVINATEVG